MLIDQVEALCLSARRELLLVAPFIKMGVMSRVLSLVSPEVSVTAVTRWWPQEIASGVSDLEIWDLFRSQEQRRLWLRNDLHAKVYRADDKCLVGSANLTGRALGLSAAPNLELMLPVERTAPAIAEFETELWTAVIEVDDDLHETTRALVEALPVWPDPIEAPEVDIVGTPVPLSQWIPLTRQPEDLAVAYEGPLDRLSAAAAAAACADLAALHVPPGLDRQTFQAFVGVALLRAPTVMAIDRFVGERERRFGEVRDLLATLTLTADPDRTWQTLFRWLMHFLRDRYQYRRPGHSELIGHRNPR